MSDEINTSNRFDPDAEDFFADEIKPKPLGPLDRKPGYSGLLAVALTYFCVVIASGIYWVYPPARVLAVSGQTVFADGEWWRLFSALLVHANFFHLLSNTPMFLVFGFLLRGYFGPTVFPLSCMIAGVLANLITVNQMPAEQYLVGMSGMIYAMVAMWMAFYMRFEINYPLGIRFFRASAVSLILMFPTTFNPTTSYKAHGWGFLIGLVLGAVIGQFVKPKTVPLESELN